MKSKKVKELEELLKETETNLLFYRIENSTLYRTIEHKEETINKYVKIIDDYGIGHLIDKKNELEKEIKELELRRDVKDVLKRIEREFE